MRVKLHNAKWIGAEQIRQILAAVGIPTSPEDTANKDATGGYVGLTLFKINFKNAANTFTSFFTNANTAARTYTFPDLSGTVALTTLDVNVQSGTTYTLQDSDSGKILRFTSGSAITITANTAQAVAGFNCVIEQAGAGQISFDGTATKVNADSHTKTYGQYAVIGLHCSVAGTFNFYGRTTA